MYESFLYLNLIAAFVLFLVGTWRFGPAFYAAAAVVLFVNAMALGSTGIERPALNLDDTNSTFTYVSWDANSTTLLTAGTSDSTFDAGVFGWFWLSIAFGFGILLFAFADWRKTQLAGN